MAGKEERIEICLVQRRLADEQLAGFQSDFRIVADYFVQMRKNGTYQGGVSDVRHMREVLQLLSVLTDDARFRKTIDSEKEGDKFLLPMLLCFEVPKLSRSFGIKYGSLYGREYSWRNLAVPKGQWEIAYVLGYSRLQSYIYIK